MYKSALASRNYFLHAPKDEGEMTGSLLVLWHGAGGDVDHPTIVGTTQAFVAAGGHAVRARFPYRVEGRKAPDRMPKLLTSARELLSSLTAYSPLAGCRLFLGGRSMGGRMTSMLVSEGFAADGLVLLSYPLHPVGKKDKLRADHLPDIPCPMLFAQGDKDNMADLTLLEPIVAKLGGRATLRVFEKGDHSMNKVDPQAVSDAVLTWVRSL